MRPVLFMVVLFVLLAPLVAAAEQGESYAVEHITGHQVLASVYGPISGSHLFLEPDFLPDEPDIGYHDCWELENITLDRIMIHIVDIVDRDVSGVYAGTLDLYLRDWMVNDPIVFENLTIDSTIHPNVTSWTAYGEEALEYDVYFTPSDLDHALYVQYDITFIWIAYWYGWDYGPPCGGEPDFCVPPPHHNLSPEECFMCFVWALNCASIVSTVRRQGQ